MDEPSLRHLTEHKAKERARGGNAASAKYNNPIEYIAVLEGFNPNANN